MEFTFQGQSLQIERYPETQNHSLRAWSAADEHLLRWLEEAGAAAGPIPVLQDRFGFLSCFLQNQGAIAVLDRFSEVTALQQNLGRNGFDPKGTPAIRVGDALPGGHKRALLHLPKSMELFRLFLHQLLPALHSDAVVAAGFMTRHFNPKMLAIAETYFSEVSQSRAWKKSRLLLLSKPKALPKVDFVETIEFPGHSALKQYAGVFSAGRIDSATRFLLDHLPDTSSGARILDLASGNGVLAVALLAKNPEAELSLLEDSWLALRSSKMNLPEEGTNFHWGDSLRVFPENHFDLIISNPPFHFGHEIDISVPVRLFKEAAHCLKPEGTLRLVANRHLNYSTNLNRFFPEVEVIAQNEKFEVLEARK